MGCGSSSSSAAEARRRIKSARQAESSRTLARMANAKVDWLALQDALPVDRTLAEYQERMNMFDRFDADGSGRLSAKEVVSGVHEWLRLDRCFDMKPFVVDGIVSIRRLAAKQSAAPPTSRASSLFPHEQFGRPLNVQDDAGAAGGGGQAEEDEAESTSVDRNEFRLVLLFIRDYFCLWRHFCLCDLNRDMRISELEFKKALPTLHGLGLCADICDGAALFKRIDENQSGSIDFFEFAEFVLEQEVLGQWTVRDCDPPAVPKASELRRQIKVAPDSMSWSAVRRRLPMETTVDDAATRERVWSAMEKLSPDGEVSLFTIDAHLARLLEISKAPVNMKLVFSLAGDGLSAASSSAGSPTMEKSLSNSQLRKATSSSLVLSGSMNASGKFTVRSAQRVAKGDFQRFLRVTGRVLELLEAAQDIDLSRAKALPREAWRDALSVMRANGSRSCRFDVLDKDGDGLITFDEYCSFVVSQSGLAASKRCFGVDEESDLA